MARLPKGISDEKKLYVVEMLEKGCTYRQISQDLGVDIRYSVVEIKCFPKNADVIGG